VNLPKSPLRRTATLAAGALLGLSGAFAITSPALAHHAEVEGTAKCADNGGWVVDWKVTGIGARAGQPFRLTQADLTPAGTTVTNIKVTPDTEVDENGNVVNPYNGSEPIFGVQTIPNDSTATEATLTVKSLFDNNHGDQDSKSDTVALPADCKKDTPPPAEEPPAEEPPAEEPPAEEPPAEQPPAEEPPASASPSVSPSTPAEPEIPTEEIPVDADIKEIFEVTCDTITIGLDNPADSLPIKLDYKTSKGEERSVTINPGEAKSEKFSASEGFNVDVTITVEAETETYSETVNVPWEKPAGEDCEGGNGGGLPVTGAAAGGVAGGAALLLAVGGALFFMARRRKVKFTA
jgi:hypothetical protein